MRLTIMIVLIFLGSSGLLGQKFTLQDTTFKNGDVLISYEVIFNYNEDILIHSSYVFLDSIISFLNSNPALMIEVGQHCDERWPDYYSIDLSDKRAKAITKYLISKGISEKRLIAQGYKDRKPLIKGAKTDEEHQKNRRTEFKVIKNDFHE